MTEHRPEDRPTHGTHSTDPNRAADPTHSRHEERSHARAEAYGTTATIEAEPERARRERIDPTRVRDDERSMIGLVRALVGDVADLVRQEATLVRVEMTEKVDQVRSGLVSVGAGAGVAYAGLILLLLAAVFGLNELIETPWLSALIVGGIVTLIGLAMLANGRNDLKAQNLTPERSARSVRKDAELLREETRRAS